MSEFFNNTMQSLQEAIGIEKRELPLEKRENTSIPVYFVPEKETEFTDNKEE